MTRDHAASILASPDVTRFSSGPPVDPKEGDVYLYKIDTSEQPESHDWSRDGIEWKNNGLRKCPVEDPVLLIRYYNLKNGEGFYRRVYALLAVQNPSFVLVHYSGDHRCASSQNYAKQKEMMQENSNELQSVSTAGSMSVELIGDLPSTSAVLPKSGDVTVSTQFTNSISCPCSNMISQADILAIYKVSNLLDGYVWEYRLIPHVFVVFGGTSEKAVEDVIRSGNVMLFYFTTGIFGFFLTFLLFSHAPIEDNLGVPIAFMLHTCEHAQIQALFLNIVAKRYHLLMTHAVNVFTDGSETKLCAVVDIFPKWNCIVTWEQLSTVVKTWLQNHAVDDLEKCLSDIKSLINCQTFKDYCNELGVSSINWSKGFKEYFCSTVHKIITQYCGRWLLKDAALYCVKDGNAPIPVTNFISLVKKRLRTMHPAIGSMLVTLYSYQVHVNKNLSQGAFGQASCNLYDICQSKCNGSCECCEHGAYVEKATDAVNSLYNIS